MMKTPKMATMAIMAGVLPWLGGCAASNDARAGGAQTPATATGDDTKVGGYSREPRPTHGDRRVVRTWTTETTPDGRTIQVPVNVEVDALGRPYPPGTSTTPGRLPATRGPRR